MEKLNQPQTLERFLQQIGLSELSQIDSSAFELLRFKKGEALVTPGTTFRRLLFLVRGRVHIYDLREDGTSFSVYLADKGTVLGDLEFIQNTSTPFFTEAASEVLCVSLASERYRKELEQNPVFLRFLLQSLAEKFSLMFQIGRPSQTVKEKLLAYLTEVQPEHRITSVHATEQVLQCSRSQLQRAVRDLCAEGKLEKTKKGAYRLIF